MIFNLVIIGFLVILEELDKICGEYCVFGFFVVDFDNCLFGIIINCDLWFIFVVEWVSIKVDEVMILMLLIIVFVGISCEDVISLFCKYKCEWFLIVDVDGWFVGLIIVKDFVKFE